jgi:hypothetical protein
MFLSVLLLNSAKSAAVVYGVINQTRNLKKLVNRGRKTSYWMEGGGLGLVKGL